MKDFLLMTIYPQYSRCSSETFCYEINKKRCLTIALLLSLAVSVVVPLVSSSFPTDPISLPSMIPLANDERDNLNLIHIDAAETDLDLTKIVVSPTVVTDGDKIKITLTVKKNVEGEITITYNAWVGPSAGSRQRMVGDKEGQGEKENAIQTVLGTEKGDYKLELTWNTRGYSEIAKFWYVEGDIDWDGYSDTLAWTNWLGQPRYVTIYEKGKKGSEVGGGGRKTKK